MRYMFFTFVLFIATPTAAQDDDDSARGGLVTETTETLSATETTETLSATETTGQVVAASGPVVTSVSSDWYMSWDLWIRWLILGVVLWAGASITKYVLKALPVKVRQHPLADLLVRYGGMGGGIVLGPVLLGNLAPDQLPRFLGAAAWVFSPVIYHGLRNSLVGKLAGLNGPSVGPGAGKES